VRDTFQVVTRARGATYSVLVAAGSGGLRSWTSGRSAASLISPEPAAEVAVGVSLTETVAYWIDAAGNPRARAIN
jgi:hypothetical protein